VSTPRQWAAAPSGSDGPSDGEVVRRVLAGDTEAYAFLVTRHQEGLFRYARGMGIVPDAAGDLVQDALVRAFRYLANCEEPERFEMWAFRILRNAALDYLKNIRRRAVSTDDVILLDRGPDPEAQTARAELRDALEEGLGRLPIDLRDAFLMKHLEELSYEEMQRMTGASKSALKMRVLRAREMLRQALVERDELVPM